MSSELMELRRWFELHARVLDIEKGYILVSELNIVLDTKMLGIITRCWAEHYKGMEIDALAPLPDAAMRLVSPLALTLNVKKTLPAKKRSRPKGWEELGTIVGYEAESFTGPQQEVMQAFIGGLEKGMKVLLVDDVVATGRVSTAAVLALLEAGVEVVGIATIFDKEWQRGIEKITTKTGVPVYSLVTITGITPAGKVIVRK